jgi:hypothetical protein
MNGLHIIVRAGQALLAIGMTFVTGLIFFA